MIIKLVRHGQSEINAKVISHGSIGDYSVRLTEFGKEQASQAGKEIGLNFISSALCYRSPYCRARQTFECLVEGAQKSDEKYFYPEKVYEDPRLREMDYGFDDVASQEIMRKKHGWFYYRFSGGESPADCYDRCCTFLESLMRQIDRKRGINHSKKDILIVTHGMTIRCFVTRFMHLSVEQFENLQNPKNCDIITIANKTYFDKKNGPAQFMCGMWGVSGLRFRNNSQ